ncbi:uncharacterized protein N7458_006399 [Penicillium daleae]|uniref:Transcription factor domain-containing protein n=1 Tax=Penicillium daleae TaxID=63821 RepID=A0AAD6G2T8_9EURO|nr:uncharacterized protein N7458_006399 [Penicillium daleae]KAJ5449950.1 hypothetical protein N7458_006399 [Penicillium daleae]
MQCLRLDFDEKNLGLPLCIDELMEHSTANVEQLVIHDDELSLSIEGIDTILVQAQFYANMGRPRNAWTTLRRGLSHALMLDLHRISVPATGTCPARLLRREGTWWHLVENQCDPVQSSSDPVDLEEELQALAGLMPPRWWQLPSQPLSGLKESILEMHERMATQFCHYQAHIYLPLLLMLQSPVDARYENNRAKCLVASRQMIQIYAQLHDFAGGKINICRVIDLQAFTATIIVILGLLGYGPRSLDKRQQY